VIFGPPGGRQPPSAYALGKLNGVGCSGAVIFASGVMVQAESRFLDCEESFALRTILLRSE